MLTPCNRWIWSDTDRRVQKLLRFSETRTDGGAIFARSEVHQTPSCDALLEHAIDESVTAFCSVIGQQNF